LPSSNQRETAAVLRGLLSFKQFLNQERIHGLPIRSDNMVTLYNLQRQGAGLALLRLMCAICSVLLELDIRIQVEHIPGIENVAADAMSRIDSSGDYSLRRDVYDHATRILQVRPTIDLFADNKNNKCRRFVAWSRRNGEGAEAYDAFALQAWTTTGLPYISPPVQLLGRTLQRIVDEKLTCLIVLLKSPSQAWWNLLRQRIRRVVELGGANQVLVPGEVMKSSPTKKELPPGLFVMALLTPLS
jgi:hypothetical protein